MRRFCLILAMTLLFSGWTLAEDAGTPETVLRGMSLREKVAQMMIVSFRTWKEVPEGENPKSDGRVPVTELNDEIRSMLARNRFGGILLFGENFRDPEQTLRLVSDMQKGGGVPRLIFVDQEGGNVNRVSFSTTGVGSMALGASADAENARKMAAIHGKEIGLMGIHADFAPVVDINSNPANPVIGIRSFSDDPQTVSAFGCAYLEGLHDAGIIAALKHFPGHGNTATDSHTGFPLIGSTYEELKALELIPFQAAIQAGADMVMTAHIQYPQIEKETYPSVSTGEQVYLPATMSRVILTDILRHDMGFDGVIVTDALDMKAITDNFSMEDTLTLTIQAGVDLLILPAVYDSGHLRDLDTYLNMAVALVESGRIEEGRIDESVLRILKLKEKYGVLGRRDFTVTQEEITVTQEEITAARNGVGSDEHNSVQWEIARQALTLLERKKGAFPLEVKAGEKTLILFADSCASRAGAGELLRKMLEEREALPRGAEIIVMTNTRNNAEACIRAAAGADHVILVHRVYSAACLDPATEDGFSSAAFDRVIQAVHEAGKTVIVVSCQLPYDAARFPEADAVLLTYWCSGMREMPAADSHWSPNLPAGLLACFGLMETPGRLPVNIPVLDESFHPTEEILWPRGTSASGRGTETEKQEGK